MRAVITVLAVWFILGLGLLLYHVAYYYAFLAERDRMPYSIILPNDTPPEGGAPLIVP